MFRGTCQTQGSYYTPHRRRITSATRDKVHSSVRYPCAAPSQEHPGQFVALLVGQFRLGAATAAGLQTL